MIKTKPRYPSSLQTCCSLSSTLLLIQHVIPFLLVIFPLRRFAEGNWEPEHSPINSLTAIKSSIQIWQRRCENETLLRDQFIYKGVTLRWKSVINLLPRQIYSVGFFCFCLFLFFGQYLQQTLLSSNRLQSRIPDLESGVVFRAAAEWPASDVISQLLYEFRILLLYLLSKLLSRLDEAREVS